MALHDGVPVGTRPRISSVVGGHRGFLENGCNASAETGSFAGSFVLAISYLFPVVSSLSFCLKNWMIDYEGVTNYYLINLSA